MFAHTPRCVVHCHPVQHKDEKFTKDNQPITHNENTISVGNLCSEDACACTNVEKFSDIDILE